MWFIVLVLMGGSYNAYPALTLKDGWTHQAECEAFGQAWVNATAKKNAQLGLNRIYIGQASYVCFDWKADKDLKP